MISYYLKKSQVKDQLTMYYEKYYHENLDLHSIPEESDA